MDKPMTTSDIIGGLFLKGLHLAQAVKGNVFIRLEDENEFSFTFTTDELWWEQYCAEGIKPSPKECRSDVHGHYLGNPILYRSHNKEVKMEPKESSSERNEPDITQPNEDLVIETTKTEPHNEKSTTLEMEVENCSDDIESPQSSSNMVNNNREYDSIRVGHKNAAKNHKSKKIAVKETSNPSETYRCDKGDNIFLSKVAVKSHIESCHNSVNSHISEAVKLNGVDDGYGKSNTNTDGLICVVCDMKFASSYEIGYHKLQHLRNVFQCNSCGKVLSSKHHLQVHSNVHSKRFSCKFCKKYFAENCTLKMHSLSCNNPYKGGDNETSFSCELCNLGFLNKTELNFHNSIHHSVVLKCIRCDLSYDTVEKLLNHLKFCTIKRINGAKGKEIMCDICGSSFVQSSCLKSHRNIHFCKYVCTLCKKCYSDKKPLAKHKLTCKITDKRNDNEIYQPIMCKRCNYAFKTEFDLACHNVLHHNEVVFDDSSKAFDSHSDYNSDDIDNTILKLKDKIVLSPSYQCKICGRNFSSKGYLQCHSNIHTGRYKCDGCQRCFAERRHLTVHVNHCNTINQNAKHCEVCNFYFLSDADLSHHNLLHHFDIKNTSMKIYPCVHCKRSDLRSRSDFLDHLQTCNYRTGKLDALKEAVGKKLHSEIKTIRNKYKRRIIKSYNNHTNKKSSMVECPTCYRLYSDSYIALHMRTHTGLRPYKCNVCPRTFKIRHHLSNHSIRHIKDKNHTCEKCGKKFPHSLYLKFHQKVHLRPAKCEICKRSFSTNQQVKRHKLTQHDMKRQYQCDLCGKCYARRTALTKHLKAHRSNGDVI